MSIATFASQEKFRDWLQRNHRSVTELLVRCYKTHAKDHKRAWAFFQAQPPWYRRTSSFWVMEAKREETRERRLAELIARSAKRKAIKLLDR